jgi:AcrR family transcriptional regulator
VEVAVKKKKATPRRRTPQQARATAMVTALVQGAARVLARRGYANTTTNHIAVAAGASIGSLYEYFRDKDELVVAVARAHVDAGATQLRATLDLLETQRGQPLPVIVRALVTTMVELHRAEPTLHHRLSTEIPRYPTITRRLHDVEKEVVTRLIALLDGHPEVHTRRPELAIVMCVQAIDALTHRWYAAPGMRPDVDEAIDELSALVVNHLTAWPSSAM